MYIHIYIYIVVYILSRVGVYGPLNAETCDSIAPKLYAGQISTIRGLYADYTRRATSDQSYG